MAHSENFRKKVLNELNNGLSTGQAVKKFKVSYGTIAAWKKTSSPAKSANSQRDTLVNKLTAENVKLKAFIFDKVYGGVVNENRN